ncbi:type IV secretory system conjugative DNA transfer family protein [Tenacibaculum halocynthiae]|uniref:type IV secretory system conjugative DNA transfer family protein n=1 Tax=Tenacibaculum halocynthiae TaxID=1254437 RepID=UPI003D659729
MGFLYDLFFGITSNNEAFDNARFMNRQEERKVLTHKPEGFCVDGTACYLEKSTSYKGVIICGSVGSGKSQLVITHLLRKQVNSSVFILDPSKEIRERTADYLRSIGMRIKVLDLDNPAQGETLQYNPLLRAKKDEHKGGFEDFVELLVSCNSSGNSGDNFWEQSAKVILLILVKALMNDDQNQLEPNLESLQKLLNWFDVKQGDLNAFIHEYLPEENHEEYEAFIGGTEPKVRKSIISTCKSCLSMMGSKTMRYITNKDTLKMESLRSEPTIIYVHVREDRVNKMKFILSILNSQLFSFLMEMPVQKNAYYPVDVILEEFSSYYIDSFEKYAVTLRKRRVCTVLVLQDLNQIHAVYGKHSDTIISNMVSKIIFGGCGLKVSKFIEEMGGLTQVEHEGRLIQRPLISALSMRQLASNKAILLSGNSSPKMLSIKYWYQQRRLVKKTQLQNN